MQVNDNLMLQEAAKAQNQEGSSSSASGSKAWHGSRKYSPVCSVCCQKAGLIDSNDAEAKSCTAL